LSKRVTVDEPHPFNTETLRCWTAYQRLCSSTPDSLSRATTKTTNFLETIDSFNFDRRHDNLASSESFDELIARLTPTAEEEQYNARWNQKLKQVFTTIDLQFPAPADPSDRIKAWRGADGMPLSEAEYRLQQQEMQNGGKSLKRTRDEAEPEVEETVTRAVKKVRQDAVDTPISAVGASSLQANTSHTTNLQPTPALSTMNTSPVDTAQDMASARQSTSEQPITTTESFNDVFAFDLKMANSASDEEVPYHQEPLQAVDHLTQAEFDSFFEDDDSFFEDNSAIAELPFLAGDLEGSPSPTPAAPKEQWNAMSPVVLHRLFEAVSPAEAKYDRSKLPKVLTILSLPQSILAHILDHLGGKTVANLVLTNDKFREAAFDSAAFKCERSHEDDPVWPPVSPLPAKVVLEILDDVEDDAEGEEELVPETEVPLTLAPGFIPSNVPEQRSAAISVAAFQPEATPAQPPRAAPMPAMDATIQPGQYLVNPTMPIPSASRISSVVPAQQSTASIAPLYYPAAVLMQQPTPVRVPQATGPSVPVFSAQNAPVQQSAVQPGPPEQQGQYRMRGGTSAMPQQRSTAPHLATTQHMSNIQGHPSAPSMAATQAMAAGLLQHMNAMDQHSAQMQHFFVPSIGQGSPTPASFTRTMPRAPSVASNTPVSRATASRKRKLAETSPSKVQPNLMKGMGTPYGPMFPSPATSTPATPSQRQRVQGPQPGQNQTPTRMSGTPGPNMHFTPGGNPMVQPDAFGGVVPGYHNPMATPQMMHAQMVAQQGRPNLQVQTQLQPQMRAGTPAGRPPRLIPTTQPGQMMHPGLQQVRGPTPQQMGQRPPMTPQQMAQQMAMQREYARREAATKAMLQKNAVGRQTPQAGMGYGGRTPVQMQQLAQMQAQARTQVPVGVQRQIVGMGGVPQMMQQRSMMQPGMVPSHPMQQMHNQQPAQGLGVMMPGGQPLQGSEMASVPQMQNQQFSGTGLTPVSALPDQFTQGTGLTPASSTPIQQAHQTVGANPQQPDMPADYLEFLKNLGNANRGGQNGMGESWMPF
jgi:hypothetical protein